MANNRPKIAVPVTSFDKVVETITVVVLVLAWIYTLVQYPKLPSIIPTHFDGQGNVDGLGPKWTLFLTTGMATVFFGLLTYLNRHPHWFNYPVAITSENALRMYTIATQMMRTLKAVLVGVFFAINWQMVQVAMQPDFSGSKYVIFGILAAIFGSVFYFLIQLFKNS